MEQVMKGDAFDKAHVVLLREKRLDKAVRQATWHGSAFGHPAELRRIWTKCLERGSVWESLNRDIIAFWHMPAKDGYAAP